MINYLIDASIYALPECVPENPVNELIESYNDYFKNLNTLMNHIYPQIQISRSSMNFFLKVNQFLFSYNDIIFISKNNLFPDKASNNKLIKILTGKQKRRIHDISNILISDILRINRYYEKKQKPGNLDDKNQKPGRVSILEEYISIDSFDVKVNKACNPDMANSIKNVIIAKNLNKNIHLLSFINKCIYGTSDITSILTTSDEKECTLDITMENISHKLNNTPNRIWISNGYVKNTNIRKIKNEQYASLVDVIKSIEKNNSFKETIIFSDTIKDSINEYEEKLLHIINNCEINERNDIDYFKKEYSKTVFNCINILDKLVKYHQNTIISRNDIPISKNFECRSIKYDNTCKKCCSFLKICGFDCSNENTQRIIGDESYVVHLKPYSYFKEGNEKHLVDLTLRIYFKWEESKIKIGWIGSHF